MVQRKADQDLPWLSQPDPSNTEKVLALAFKSVQLFIRTPKLPVADQLPSTRLEPLAISEAEDIAYYNGLPKERCASQSQRDTIPISLPGQMGQELTRH
jgi:hypothetical protein